MMKTKRTLFLLLGVLIFLFASCGGSESETQSEVETGSAVQTVAPEQSFLAKEAIEDAWGRYEENNDYALYGDTHVPFENPVDADPFTMEMVVKTGLTSRNYEGPYLLQIKKRMAETSSMTYYEADILHNYGNESDHKTLIFGVIGTQSRTQYWPLPSCGDVVLATVRYIVGDEQSPEDAKTPNFGNFEIVRVMEHKGTLYGVNELSRNLFSAIDNPMTQEEINKVISAHDLAKGSAVIPYDVLEAYMIDKIDQIQSEKEKQ